ALETIGVEEDLLPLGARIDRHLDVGEAHRLVEVLLLLHLDDRVLLFLRREQLLAVERDLDGVGIVENRLPFALLEMEEAARALLLVRAGARLAAIDDLAFCRREVRVRA